MSNLFSVRWWAFDQRVRRATTDQLINSTAGPFSTPPAQVHVLASSLAVAVTPSFPMPVNMLASPLVVSVQAVNNAAVKVGMPPFATVTVLTNPIGN